MSNVFYRFRSAHNKNVYRIQPLEEYDTLDFLHEKTPLIQHNLFTITEGTKAFEILPFNDSSNFAISKRMKELLEQNDIKGWSSFPIIINGLEDEYFAFQNLSKAGPITNLDAVNDFETDNHEFDVNTWDGSDVFHLENTGMNVCTEKVKNILEKAKISNLEILPL